MLKNNQLEGAKSRVSGYCSGMCMDFTLDHHWIKKKRQALITLTRLDSTLYLDRLYSTSLLLMDGTHTLLSSVEKEATSPPLLLDTLLSSQN